MPRMKPKVVEGSSIRSSRSKRTSSRRVGRVASEPFTLDHFRRFSRLLILDNGKPWVLEPFQEEVLADVFAGYREVLAVLPTGSYKTTTFGGVGIYFLLFLPEASIPVGAASKQQAGILYEQAAGFVRRSPALQLRFRVRDGEKRIAGAKGTPFEGRGLRVLSASDDTGDGLIPRGIIFVDELHRHKGHDLYGTWRDKLTKNDAQMVTLSTAGDSDENPLERLRDQARKMRDGTLAVEGRHTVARSKGREFVMHEWALKPDDDYENLEVVKLANPASQVTLEELRMRRDSPSTTLWQWQRFTCNLRAKGEESAIPPEDFDARRHDGLEIPVSVPVYVGLDLGWKIDHTAVVPVGWESGKRRLVAGAVTLAPPVEEDQIVAALLRLWEGGLDVRGVVYDPNAGGEQMVQQLEAGSHQLQTDDDARAGAGLRPLSEVRSEPMLFVEHSQDNSPMSLAAVRFDEAFRFGWVRHDGLGVCSSRGCRCGGFRGHVTNAVVKTLGGERWRYDRPSDAKGGKRAKYPIDALTAMVMAHSVAVAELGESRPKLNLDDYHIVQL